MPYQHHPVERELVEPGVEVPGVVGEQVREVGLVGFPHPDEIRRQLPPVSHPGDHLPPQQ
jgi:hypothetical protein